jgi:septum formation protein
MPKKALILASASPRRRRLLEQVGFTFSVIPSDIEEDDVIPNDPPANVQAIALCKAKSVAETLDTGIVIAADTQILLDDEVLGKPKDEADAIRMLSGLSGKIHQAITGVALMDLDTGSEETWVEITRVKFRKLPEEEITDYIKTGEPMGKAGAYGIQGRAAAFVERIEGCYFNIVGLPLAKLVEKIRKIQG